MKRRARASGAPGRVERSAGARDASTPMPESECTFVLQLSPATPPVSDENQSENSEITTTRKALLQFREDGESGITREAVEAVSDGSECLARHADTTAGGGNTDSENGYPTDTAKSLTLSRLVEKGCASSMARQDRAEHINPENEAPRALLDIRHGKMIQDAVAVVSDSSQGAQAETREEFARTLMQDAKWKNFRGEPKGGRPRGRLMSRTCQCADLLCRWSKCNETFPKGFNQKRHELKVHELGRTIGFEDLYSHRHRPVQDLEDALLLLYFSQCRTKFQLAHYRQSRMDLRKKLAWQLANWGHSNLKCGLCRKHLWIAK